MGNYEFLLKNKPIVWINDKLEKYNEINMKITDLELKEAEERLNRFSELIEILFPETRKLNGLIESKLTKIPEMEKNIENKSDFKGELYLKEDNNLPIAGSVKARGGIYEVLKHAEELAIEKGLLEKGDSYKKLADKNMKEFFSSYKIQVGSTGNLGLSIGLIGSKLGFNTIVHMSEDAKKWKKDLLKEKGVTVKEYSGNYSEAVKEGRKNSNADFKSYFIDDENSKDLFLGYTVAAKRLEKQIDKQGIVVDENHPLFVYIPCGVGGAPGGIGYGLKKIYKDNVHLFFIEPIESPCMLLSIYSNEHEKISVQDIGLSGKTEADGLAVGRASGFISRLLSPLLSGVFTVEDKALNEYMKELWDSESIFLEPSGCSSFEGPLKLLNDSAGVNYINKNGLTNIMENSTHITWGTGGNLVPENIRRDMLNLA